MGFFPGGSVRVENVPLGGFIQCGLGSNGGLTSSGAITGGQRFCDGVHGLAHAFAPAIIFGAAAGILAKSFFSSLNLGHIDNSKLNYATG